MRRHVFGTVRLYPSRTSCRCGSVAGSVMDSGQSNAFTGFGICIANHYFGCLHVRQFLIGRLGVRQAATTQPTERPTTCAHGAPNKLRPPKHLLLSCVFGRRQGSCILLVSRHLSRRLGYGMPIGLVVAVPERIDKEQRACFDFVFLFIAWSFWKGRNRRVFECAAVRWRPSDI